MLIKEAEYRKDVKQQIETYGNYGLNRNQKQSERIKKEKAINERFLCDLCSKAITSNTKYKHVSSALCKRTRNLQRYLELFEGFKLMSYKHIANGDVDFDGVIKLEPHEKKVE